MGDVDARVHMFTATALGRGTVASLTLGRLYPEESPRYSFYRRLSGPQDQSGIVIQKDILSNVETTKCHSPRYLFVSLYPW